MSRTPEAVLEKVNRCKAARKKLPYAPYSVIARMAGVSRQMAMYYLKGNVKCIRTIEPL
jgi:hypothetical protein